MSDSDSGAETIRYQKKEEKSDKLKKRRRSNSVNSNDFERIKKKKHKNKHNSDEISDDDSQINKNKRQKSKSKYPEKISVSKNMKRQIEPKKSKLKEKRRSRSRSVDISHGKIYASTNEGKIKKRAGASNASFEDTDNSDLNRNRRRDNESDTDERNLSSTNKQSKSSSYKKDKKYSKADDDDGRDSSRYQNEERIGRTKHSKKEKSYELERLSRKQSDKKLHEHHNRKSPSHNEDDDEKSSTSVERPFRHYNFSRGPVRKNSDSYWNKYSDRLKESVEHNVEVGPRYYGANENLKKDRRSSDNDKSKQDEVVETEKEFGKEEAPKEQRQKKTMDLLTSRTGGAYIPPARLRMMQESITDKSSAAYQRLAWEALKKSIQGHVNKVNTSNIRTILKAVQKENIIRGKGILCRAVIQAQAASPSFTNVYAAFISVLNAKFPKIGELLLKRLVVQFRRGFKRNDKTICITAATFIAHLVNQEVAHEILALEILTMLIETPTDDSVEVAIAFLKECGMKLTEVSSKGVMAIFDMLRNILHEGNLEKRVQYMIEVMFQIRKDNFADHPAVVKELDLVEEYDRIQHMVTLEENHDPQDILNVFKLDPDYEANEAKYKSLIEEDSDDEGSGSGSSGSDDSDDSEEENENQEKGENGVIIDRTETNLIALRKTIYLTIQSSLDFEECAHKLMRMELKPGQEKEMVHMFIDCCAEQRTYEKFFGLLSQRFCQINRAYIEPFHETFRESYETIHRMTNDKLRNIAKLFAHLLFTDAISWDVLATIRLNEDDTTSSSRIFIKILFLELSEYMGLAKLNQRVKDPNLQIALAGLFPRDNPKHTRFAINFFTSIGLGGLTDELREHLKSQPKESLVLPQLVEDLSSSSDSSSSDSSDSSDSSSSDSSSSDSEESRSAKGKKKKLQPKKKKDSIKSVKEKKSSISKKTDRSKSDSKKKYTSTKKRDR